MRLSFSAGGSPVQALDDAVKGAGTQVSRESTVEEKDVANAVLALVHARLAELPETCSVKVQVAVDIQAERI